MKSFSQFMEQSIPFRRDNPGGDWLKSKQKWANEDYRKYKGLNGSVTGYFTQLLHLPTDYLNSLPGARGEDEFRHRGPKQDMVSREIGHPSNFNSKDNPIMLGINHRGEAFVIEGNHRTAYARRNGIPHVHAEVRYYNGGEDVEGLHSPRSLFAMHKDT